MHRFIYLAFLLIFAAAPARAELQIDVTRGQVSALPIAIPEFKAESREVSNLARGIPDIIRNNLKNSGLFNPLDRRALIQTELGAKAKPDFAAWKATDAQALINGTVSRGPDGRIKVEFRLWDLFAEQQMEGMSYRTTAQNYRRIAHIISDVIYERITGEKGYFDTRIVYIAESGDLRDRTKRLAIMDQDGANHQFLTSGEHLVLTPRFSPNSQRLTYMAYVNNQPRVYLYDLNTGEQQVLGNFKGMTFAPRFSPDGRNVIMTMSENGNSDIYTMELSTRRVNRLTQNTAIDTSPSYAPNGDRIVFESDRGGDQQLYTMRSDGSNIKRITFGEGRYANPVWSPRGDLIAFTKIYRGQFYIGVVRPDGSGERLITRAFHVEGPSWSPNGRVLIYFKELPAGRNRQRRESRIYTIDLTGFNERQLETPVGASDPTWSPPNP